MKTSLTVLKQMLFMFLMTFSISPLMAQDISQEKVFYYYAALSNLSPDKYIELYGSTFDTDNYNKNISNEFERNQYKNKILKLVSDGISSINYEEKFVTSELAVLGEYSFVDHSFPILQVNFRSEKRITSKGRSLYGKNLDGMIFYLNDKVINQNEYSWNLKMSEEEAKSLIARNGRRIHLVITFSILNRPTFFKEEKYEYRFKGYFYSVEIYDQNNKKIGMLYPTLDYYDKIYGVKMKNGVDTIYHQGFYRAFFSSGATTQIIDRTLPSKNGANYYRITKYLDGKIIEATDYFISGKLAMKGNYWPYCVEPEYANGLFSWYYENGIKKQEVSFINGEMNGCFNAWESNGECVTWSSNTFINNGIPSGENKDCACKGQNKKSIETIESSKVNMDEKMEKAESNISNSKNVNNRILTSSMSGDESGDYLAINTDIFISKKPETKQRSNVLFLFDYKEGTNAKIKPEVKDYIIKQFKDWVEKSVNGTSANLESFTEDSLFKVELIFTARLFAMKSLDAYITTRIIITQNGKLISDDSFERSKSLFMESNEPYIVLDNVIKNCEKKISKAIEEYMSIKL